MSQKIAILGSTGSIGKTLLNIISKNKNKYKIVLLTSNKNYKDLLRQAKKFNVKNLIIKNKESYLKLKKISKKNKFNIFNSFESFNLIFKSKIDYCMSSIIGLEGLEPTLKIIKHTKYIAIANKESIICGWDLIRNELTKYKCKFIPVDSEHFSIWYGLKNNKIDSVEKIFITASGGPFYKTPLNKFDTIKIYDATNHPTWKMGKKISIDSATMINKVYEVIEAKNIFNIPYDKIEILIHPDSYIHSLIKFFNGLIKIIAHDTTMKIPIFNSIYRNNDNKLKTKNIDLNKLNNLQLKKVNFKKFPILKILKKLPSKNTLFYTLIVSANDTYVELFLKNQIKFTDIHRNFIKFINNKKFKKYIEKKPNSLKDIQDLNNYVRSIILKNMYNF